MRNAQPTELEAPDIDDSYLAETSDPGTHDATPAAVPSNDGQLIGPLALMLAILEDAIQCAGLPSGDPHPQRRRLRSRARLWIRASDPNWLFSFESICDALAIDAGTLRRRILENGAVDRGRRRRKIHGLPRQPRKLTTRQGRTHTS